MKYFTIILFFFTAFCNAQDEFKDYIRVTAYKIIMEYDDGPCSIVTYVKNEGIGNFVSAIQSRDKEFALQLVSLKKEAKKNWASAKRNCMKGWIGLETIPNMFVIEINAYRDTLFTTEENQAIYLFEEQKEYHDNKGKLKSILPQEFKDFFENKPLTPIDAVNLNQLDSVSINSITYGSKQIYGLNRKSFEKEFGKFFFITATIDSLPELKTTVSYSIYNSTLHFRKEYNEIEKMINYFPDSYDGSYPNEIQLTIAGILPGDEEKIFTKKFPASARYKYYRSKKTKIEELDDDYYYEIKISGNRGLVSFLVKQHRIKEIEVIFNYSGI